MRRFFCIFLLCWIFSTTYSQSGKANECAPGKKDRPAYCDDTTVAQTETTTVPQTPSPAPTAAPTTAAPTAAPTTTAPTTAAPITTAPTTAAPTTTAPTTTAASMTTEDTGSDSGSNCLSSRGRWRRRCSRTTDRPTTIRVVTTEMETTTEATTLPTTTPVPRRVYSSAPEIISFLENTFTDPTATYNSLVFPRNNFNETIYIDIGLTLIAITDFDELAGTLEVIGILSISWYDELADDDYDSDKHGHFTETTIPNQFLWKPPVSLFNSALAIVPVGDKSNYVRLYRTTKKTDPYYGYARMVWTPGVVTKTGCVVDVGYFPFDKQSCNITFTNWGFTTDQVKFKPTADSIDLRDYTPSDEWTITKTKLIEETLDNGSFVKFEISLERKPMYYLVNFFLPVVIMGILNALVFILPLESGERVGYSVTSFLTFAVYLTLIADGMPRTSEPMAILSYYLVSMVVMSSVATIITIFTLRVYLKDEDDPIPTPVTLLVACLNCLVCTVEDDDDDEDDETPLLSSDGLEMDTIGKGSARFHQSPIEDNTSWTSETPDNKYEVDWKLVASTLDAFSFLAILGGSIAIAIVFLVPLVTQA